MFELTNEQRTCFALLPVTKDSTRLELKASPYDDFKTFVYMNDHLIFKCIGISDERYFEYDLSERVSEDGAFLFSKTAKGKFVPLTSSALLKRNGTSMCLKYEKGLVRLYNCVTNCCYFNNKYINCDIKNIGDFSNWVQNWCEETTPEDLAEIQSFATQKRKNVRYQEGDVFRFKIDRRSYGYGRLLLDYHKMRKANEPFWDNLMRRPLVCSVYHIITDRKTVTANELRQLTSLPSTIIADDNLFYGEYEIIGNIPVTDQKDYPIMYGECILQEGIRVRYQCGKTFREIKAASALYNGFQNNAVSFYLNFTLDILQKCISESSNAPYWAEFDPFTVDRDLRNPKFKNKLAAIQKQIFSEV